jgi:solute carrier family 31 (copper transporter), member 1
MASTFFESVTTPLFWSWWQPWGLGQYAATCVFLIILGLATRILVAMKPVLESTAWTQPNPLGGAGPWLLHHPENRTADSDAIAEELQKDAHDMALLYRGVAPSAARNPLSVLRSRWIGTPLLSRFTRALFEVLLAGMGYFL